MMRTRRVPKLDWPVHLFQDVGVLELMDEDDHFSEAADFAATAGTLSFVGDLASVMRYQCAETASHGALA
jgi:hypothetical protein